MSQMQYARVFTSLNKSLRSRLVIGPQPKFANGHGFIKLVGPAILRLPVGLRAGPFNFVYRDNCRDAPKSLVRRMTLNAEIRNCQRIYLLLRGKANNGTPTNESTSCLTNPLPN